MMKQDTMIYQTIESFGLPVYADELSESEEQQLVNDMYNCIIIETGNMSNPTGRTVTQDFFIYYITEHEQDIDYKTVELITLLSQIEALNFKLTKKERLQIKDTDRYVDRVAFLFKRVIKVGCHV